MYLVTQNIILTMIGWTIFMLTYPVCVYNTYLLQGTLMFLISSVLVQSLRTTTLWTTLYQSLTDRLIVLHCALKYVSGETLLHTTYVHWDVSIVVALWTRKRCLMWRRSVNQVELYIIDHFGA